MCGRDRLEVRTLRCGRNNPGSNPGHGIILFFLCNFQFHFCSHPLFLLLYNIQLWKNEAVLEEFIKRNPMGRYVIYY